MTVRAPDLPADAAGDLPLDGLPLGPAGDLVVVAHQDDDLLFMQPDLSDAVAAHEPTTIVYVTAGDGGNGLDYADSRASAVEAAYGLVVGSQDWRCGWIAIADHVAHHCRLAAGELSLVFLGYPDGKVAGDGPSSLLRLWEGQLDAVETIAQRTTRYDQEGLIATVARVVAVTQPRIIRTLEIAGSHGADHSDHMMVGALTLIAAARAGSDARLLSYRGYDINSEPPNTPEPMFERASLAMRAYEACQVGCGTCGVTPCPTLTDPRYDGFLHRSYVVGVRHPPVAGLLRLGSGCAIVDGHGDLVLGNCGSAPLFHLERGGALRTGDRCVSVRSARVVHAGTCGGGGGGGGEFAFDDEGHLWVAVVPPPASDMTYDHGTCLYADSGRVVAGLCGAARDVRWQLVRPTVTTARAALGIARTGRAIRLADLTGDGKADLCAIDGGGLVCAVGDGAGGFARATRIDAPAMPLAIDPVSLALGDVDRDGLADACGHDPGGIVCATAASGFAAARWSAGFATATTASIDARSLAIVDGQVCGLSDRGVSCAQHGSTSLAILSAWPPASAAVWPADLDADDRPDWCAATADGPACGLASDQSIDADGVPWGFSWAMQVEGSLATDGALIDADHAVLADVSGDGRADLCAPVGGRVECALARGRGFGPRTPVLLIPNAAAGGVAALWLGDLDGDGKADPCVDGTVIRCALSP